MTQLPPPEPSSEISVAVHDRISMVPAAEWNALERGSFPFARHEYLKALEDSRSVGRETGWIPFYAEARVGGRLLAASAFYAKTHSYGEYVFDFAWAEAFASRGREYYPKLVAAIPFAPATGPKVLLHPSVGDEERARGREAIVSAWEAVAREIKASSIHALFPTRAEAEFFAEAGWISRKGFQFHWTNPGYRDFDDFLSALRSKRRREARREREQARAGLEIERLTGSDLRPKHADAMRAFYRSTVESRMGYPYLTDEFFDAAFSDLRDFALFVHAREGSRSIAGAVGFFEGDALFGRWWGALQERPALHFEASYYQGIEWAIERKIRLFEAGAQGEHKLARGFLPTETRSSHAIFDRAFAGPIRSFCEREALAIEQTMAAYAERSPFAQG